MHKKSLKQSKHIYIGRACADDQREIPKMNIIIHIKNKIYNTVNWTSKFHIETFNYETKLHIYIIRKLKSEFLINYTGNNLKYTTKYKIIYSK